MLRPSGPRRLGPRKCDAAPFDDRSVLDHEAGLGRVPVAGAGRARRACAVSRKVAVMNSPSASVASSSAPHGSDSLKRTRVVAGLDLDRDPVLGDAREGEELGRRVDVALGQVASAQARITSTSAVGPSVVASWVVGAGVLSSSPPQA